LVVTRSMVVEGVATINRLVVDGVATMNQVVVTQSVMVSGTASLN